MVKQFRIPKLGSLEKDDWHDFHDSSLIDLIIHYHLCEIDIVVSTPDEFNIPHLWNIKLKGILRLEFETTMDGIPSAHGSPVQIYDIYSMESDERKRWAQRLKDIDEEESSANRVFHIILASSQIRGWGENESIPGVSIVCRNTSVGVAPGKYRGREFPRPWIPAGDDDENEE